MTFSVSTPDILSLNTAIVAYNTAMAKNLKMPVRLREMKLFGNKKDKMEGKENTTEKGPEVEKEDVADKQPEGADQQQDETKGENEPIQEISDLEKKDLEYKELHEKFVRLYSEFDNFRKRTAKEKIDITKTASESVLKDLLPILDDFERAIENNGKVEDIESVKEGFNLIHNKLFSTLEAKGLKRMDSQGETFDVDKHEALTNIPAPSEDMKGKVVDVVEKGYLLNDKVIRFAKVVVGQ